MPGRFALLTDVAVCVLLALALDVGWQRSHRQKWVGLGLVAIAAGALVPIGLAEALPLTTHALPTPAWFSDVAPHLKPGTELLILPDPTSLNTQAMTWQAVDDFDFNMVGGYALVPGPDGHTSDNLDPPTGAPVILNDLSLDFEAPPNGTAVQTSEVRAALRKWGVQDVVVTQSTQNGPYAAGLMTAVLGRAPIWQDGAWVWYGLGNEPPFGLRNLAIYNCQMRSGPQPLAVPDCVLSAGGSKA